jgi:hypothetical protein
LLTARIVAWSARTICVCSCGLACNSCYQNTVASRGPDFRWCKNRRDKSWGLCTRSQWTLRLGVFATLRTMSWDCDKRRQCKGDSTLIFEGMRSPPTGGGVASWQTELSTMLLITI